MPANATSKLVPPKTRADVEECQCAQLVAGGDIRRVVGADVTPINNFMQWYQVILANMNTEAQRRALAASRKAASSIFADVGDEEVSLIAVPAAPAQGDVRKVEYSAEMAVVRFTPQSRDEGCPPRGLQLELNKLRPPREQFDQSAAEATLEAGRVTIKEGMKREEMPGMIKEIELLH